MGAADFRKERFPREVWVFPKMGVPQNGWFIMENPIKMDGLGVPLFSETSIWIRYLDETGNNNHKSL